MAVDGFSLLRRDRKGHRGGGVAMYVGDKYDNAVLHCSGDDELFELLWVSVRSNNTNVVVGALYTIVPVQFIRPQHCLITLKTLLEK